MPFNNSTNHPFTGPWDDTAAVYGITDSQNRVIYVGRTNNLKRRMAEHQSNHYFVRQYGPLTVWIEAIASSSERKMRETALISEYQPPCNLNQQPTYTPYKSASIRNIDPKLWRSLKIVSAVVGSTAGACLTTALKDYILKHGSLPLDS